MTPFTVSMIVLGAACALVLALSLAIARSAGRAGREKSARVAALVAAVAIVPMPAMLTSGLLAAAFGRGPLMGLLAFTTIPLAVSAVGPLAQWIHRSVRRRRAPTDRPTAPYSAVETGIPVAYWAAEAAATFSIVGAVGVVAQQLMGNGFVLVCGVPIAVALPTLLRATLAPRMTAGRLAETIARLTGVTAFDGDGPLDSVARRLADARSWTAQLARERGVRAPAVVLAPRSATYIASSDRSHAVIVIDYELFRSFQTSELHAVMAHELAHLVRNERLRRALAESLLAAWYVGVVLVYWHLRGAIGGTYLLAWLLSYAYVRQAVERWSIRRGEFSADLTAAEWLGDALPMISALHTIARVRGIPVARRLGLRPSFGERIAALGKFHASVG